MGPAIPNGNLSADTEETKAAFRSPSLARKRPPLAKAETIDLSEIKILGVQHLSEITDKLPPINEDQDGNSVNLDDLCNDLTFDYELPNAKADQQVPKSNYSS